MSNIRGGYCLQCDVHRQKIIELEDVIWHLRKEVRLAKCDVLDEVLAEVENQDHVIASRVREHFKDLRGERR